MFTNAAKSAAILEARAADLKALQQADCTHPNGYYYGDTNPPTYYCPDCGAFYFKGRP